MRAATVFLTCTFAVAIIATLTVIGLHLSGARAVGTVRGARFGMSATETRLHFSDGSRGAWRSAKTGEYDLLHWTRAGAPEVGGTRAATFVFHDGLLTAMRLVLDDEGARAQAAALPATESVELTTEGDPSGIALTYTLRLCNLSEGSRTAAKLRWAELERLASEESPSGLSSPLGR